MIRHLFSKKENIIIAAAVIILFIYIGMMQFYFLSPLKSDLNVKEQTLRSEQKYSRNVAKKAEWKQ